MHIETKNRIAGDHYRLLVESRAHFFGNFIDHHLRRAYERDQKRVFVHPAAVIVEISALDHLQRKRRLMIPANILQRLFVGFRIVNLFMTAPVKKAATLS